MTPHEDGWEKRFNENLHRFIVQPKGGDSCEKCGVSGTRTLESLLRGEYGSYKEGFCPTLAYLDSDELKSFIHSIAKQERQKGREEAVSYIDKNLMYGRDSAKNLVIHPDNLTLTLERAARTNPQEGEKKV